MLMLARLIVAVIPVNTAERAVCTFAMMVSGVSWTYVLGTAAGIAATLDPNNVLYQTTMVRTRRRPWLLAGSSATIRPLSPSRTLPTRRTN